MMIWDYDVMFGSAVQLFVLSSNILALQTLHRDDTMTRAFLAVGFAYGIRTCMIMIVHHYEPSFIPALL